MITTSLSLSPSVTSKAVRRGLWKYGQIEEVTITKQRYGYNIPHDKQLLEFTRRAYVLETRWLGHLSGTEREHIVAIGN